MHSLWKGSITFGLVNIPVSLYSGLRREETIRFHLLRKSDHTRVRNKRVAEKDDEEVPWGDIVKGYEYEKGKYVEMTDEDLDEIGLKSTRVIDIAAFVKLEEIDPVYFDTPYLVQADKAGEKPYRLLVDVLEGTKTAAVAKVVLRGGREHLVALIARDGRLIADVLHFHEELAPMDTVTAPQVKINDREREIARKLVESMRTDWKPASFHDEYEKALKDLIQRKLSGKKISAPKEAKAKHPSNVIDLVAILQQSLQQKGGSTSSAKKTRPAKARSSAKTVSSAKRRRAA
jgi:DNA end-binding protein Ku